LERAELLKRRKEIYEAKYPESKAGVRRALGMHRALGHNVAEKISATSFTEDTAQKIGVTDRTIRYEIQIAKKGQYGYKGRSVIRKSESDTMSFSKGFCQKGDIYLSGAQNFQGF
jgi:hypothetical protein